MKCPTDGSDLVMSDRQGIEIDYCQRGYDPRYKKKKSILGEIFDF